MCAIKEFYKNKSVFITGHTGFKGAWLSIWLQEMGANLTGYSLTPPTKPNLFELVDLKSRMNSIIHDIRDMESLSIAMESANPEIIFHLAAQPLVKESYKNPIETYSTNVMGTANVLEVAKTIHSLKSIVIVTSDKCYKNKGQENWNYSETDPLGGYDPYSSSKACTELVVDAYRNSFFNPDNYNEHRTAIASARAGNVIGGGDWAKDRLIPDFVKNFSKDKPVKIRSYSAIRPWQHVLEPLLGYMFLAKNLYENGQEYGESWNFGPDKNNFKTVKWIADEIVKIWGENKSWEIDKITNPHEDTYLKLDSSKASNILKWTPRWDINTTLERTINWYKKSVDNNIHQLCLNDINVYEKS